MPDPLLCQSEFARDYAAAKRAARSYGAKVWREGERVFFQFHAGPGGCVLARLACDGYPMIPPDLAFLDPVTREVSVDRRHFPPNSPVASIGGGLHLCVAGTRWFDATHDNQSTREDRNLVRLLGTLALCCDGQIHTLLRAAHNANARRLR